MVFSKRELEGYLEIDHRNSPGISIEEARLAGAGTIPVGAGQRFQSPTIKCSHCPRQIVLRPDRSRARNYCQRCDHYICDDCALLRKVSGVTCRPWKQHIDQLLEKAVRGV